VDDAEGHACLGRNVDPLDRAEFRSPGEERVGGEAVGRRRLFEPRITAPVIHWIDAAHAGSEIRMGDRPGAGPQAAAAAAEGLTRLRLDRRAVRFFRRAPAAC